MKKYFISILLCVITVLTLAFTACGNGKGNTVLEFTYSYSTPYEYSDEKSIYFNKDFDSITLNASFEIEEGVAELRILDKQSGAVVWEKTADKKEDFEIELKSITADSEYIFKIESKETKHVHLTITSPEKLVKNKEKPEVK
ncbi:MAG: hypothetical protein K2N84_02765 [Clostridia bacterium]|nr:hypothetical protein [Clostridia bacterium]